MNRNFCALFASCLLAQNLLVEPISAADPLAANRRPEVAPASPNAAVIYWQAFAAMPNLGGEQKTRYEAAIRTMSERVSDDLKPTVAMFDASLGELQRARAVSTCDWNLNYDAGPELLLPHLQKARDLSRAALLRARLRFVAGESNAALEDVAAVLKLARDCGGSPVLISLLVNIAIEGMATDVLVANLPRLTTEQLDNVAATLKSLPGTASLTDCLRVEGRMFGSWIEREINAEAAKANDPKAGGKVLAALFNKGLLEGGGQLNANDAEGVRRREVIQSLTVADVRESLRLLPSDYHEMAKIAALGPVERRARWTEFEAKLAEARKFANGEARKRFLSCSLVPAVAKVADREEQFQVRRTLLAVAVQVQRYGSQAVKSNPAFGDGLIEYRKTGTGFELRFQRPSGGKPQVLQIGDQRP